MRIIAWNCQMAFRRKYEVSAALKPDILVISESESPEYLREKSANLPWSNHVWVGDNRTKGLSVFATSEFDLRLKQTNNPSFRFVAPVDVQGPNGHVDLMAVWTQGGTAPSKAYVAHILNAVQFYGSDLNRNSVILGDFNSNPVFKQNGKKHVELVKMLDEYGFDSLYHRQSHEEHGQESKPTFYLHRNRLKPYHLDYVFCDKSREATVSIGATGDWLSLSDHMPLIGDFEVGP
ncbi:MAG: exodeoxyribonuclease-3 [Paracoccaceae bacterium]|jgi:exodeoxyribonuclease-3